MSEKKSSKNEDSWPVGVDLVEHEISTGIGLRRQLRVEINQPKISRVLQLHKDERTDYRFNLSSTTKALLGYGQCRLW